ncbi:MAG: hypothetical protein M1308_05570 [Actinobacteria bacterium]|nr:hypothetical protein [Actinomycetota bacterium]
MYDFTLPKLGQSDSELEVLDIKVKAGDIIKIGDPIVEVETEKAATILESEIEGVVEEVLVRNGDILKVGTVILRIKQK